MDDFPMPIVELRLKHMGQQIVHAFAMYENELSGHIKKSIEALMTDDSIQEEIDRLCYDCMKECIKEVFESAVVKRDLIKVMTDQVLSRINEAPSVQYPSIIPSGTGETPLSYPIITSQSDSDDDFWDTKKKDF